MIRRVLGVTVLTVLSPFTDLPAQQEPADPPPVVEVTAEDYTFEMPEEVPSGWVTFEFENAGEEEHYLAVTRLPEGKTFEDYETEVMARVHGAWTRHAARRIKRFSLPKDPRSRTLQWLSSGSEPKGGVGLTEPGTTARTTIKLDPGTYAVECAVTTEQGGATGYRGVVRELRVTSTGRKSAAPAADVRLILTGEGMEMSGELTAGPQTIAVHGKEQSEGIGTYTAYLLRLSMGAEREDVVEWVDQVTRGRFRTSVPGHSLGGVQASPQGSAAYVTVDLKPGRYAWVLLMYAKQGMVKEFTID